MRDGYIKPSVETVEIMPGTIVAGWDSQYQGGFNHNPGGDGDFATKECSTWEEEWGNDE